MLVETVHKLIADMRKDLAKIEARTETAAAAWLCGDKLCEARAKLGSAVWLIGRHDEDAAAAKERAHADVKAE